VEPDDAILSEPFRTGQTQSFTWGRQIG